MKVALDISPLQTAHQFRGIGFYTRKLKETLLAVDHPNLEIILVEKGKQPSDCDLIHYPFFDFFSLTLPLKKRKRTIVTIHDTIPLVFPDKFPPGLKGKLKFQIQKFSLKSVKAIICDSKSSRKDIIKYLGIAKEQIHVVYLASGRDSRLIKDKKLLTRIQKKYRLPAKFVLYVGDVNYHKNILGLVKACKKINTPLVIVGKQAVAKNFDRHHIENQPLVQLIKLYGQDPNVLRLGFVSDEDLVAIFNLATLYCQPSFYEGFGLPVIEAMACGTPVVSAKAASLPEICGEAALMVDPHTINSIAGGLKKVVNDNQLRAILRKRGLKQAKKFSWSKTARETIKVYFKIAGNSLTR